MIILPANTLSSGGYEVANSCRFNDGDSASMSLTYGSDGSRQIMTFSFWMKRGSMGADMMPMGIIDASTGYQADIRFSSGDVMRMYATDTSGTGRLHMITNRVFRDVGAWYHICWAIDTTQSTDTNRVKLYINGTRETNFSTETYPPQNTNLRWNGNNNADTGGITYIGQLGGSNYFDGYLAEFYFIDGTQYAASDFGEFDSDSPTIWKPKDASGLTFGSNGFYLDFEDSGDLGDDESGNTNDFTESNLAATDQATDSPTNNYITMLSHTLGSYATLSEGGLKAVGNSASDSGQCLGSMGITNGKWYYEQKISEDTSNANYPLFFVVDTTNAKFGHQSANGSAGNPDPNVIGMSMADGYFNGSSHGGGVTGASSNNDIISFYFDMDNGAFYVARNGSLLNSGDPTSGSSRTGALVTWTPDGRTYVPMSVNFNGSIIEWNFGNPTFSISSGNQDPNGYGNFEYATSGFYAINTKNLAEYG